MDITVFRAWLQARLNMKSERGANMVEYVLLLAFIALVVILAVKTLGGTVKSKFNNANTSLNTP